MTVLGETEQQEFLTASRYGDLQDVQILLEQHGASLLKVQGFNGNTALHLASANGHTEVVEFLVSKPDLIEVNQINEAGNTALHWAASAGAFEIAKLLVKAGADTSIKNNMGRTSFFEAKHANHEELADFLLEILEEGDKDKEEENKE